jgi:DNA ligase-1
MNSIKPLLACEVDLSTLEFPVYVSPKLDGIRTLIIEGKPKTRNFKNIPNKYVYENISIDIQLDGEIIVGEPTSSEVFRNTTKGVMSFEGKPDFKYYVFDIIDDSKSFSERRDLLISLNLPSYCIKVNDVLINSLEELLTYETKCLEQGYEGVMIRSPKGIYKYGRSTKKEQILMKLKRFKDIEGEVIGFEEKFHNNNPGKINELGYTERSSHKDNLIPANTLGSLIVRTDEFTESFKIGTGFNDEQRLEIWSNREKYYMKNVTFKYQEVGVKDKPRFPVFKGFREDL